MANETGINVEPSKINASMDEQTILDDNTLVDRIQTKTTLTKSTASLFKTQRFLTMRPKTLRNFSLKQMQRRWLSPTASFPRIKDQCPELLKKIMPYLTIGTLYIISDPVMDFGFVAIPAPWDTVYYIGRYTAIILYSLAKFLRKRHRVKNAPIFIRPSENLSFKQRRRSPAARLRRSVEKKEELRKMENGKKPRIYHSAALIYLAVAFLMFLPIVTYANSSEELVTNGNFRTLNGWKTQPSNLVEDLLIPGANESCARLASAENTLVSLSQVIEVPANVTGLKVSWMDHGYIEKSPTNEYKVLLYDANTTKVLGVLFDARNSIDPTNGSLSWSWKVHEFETNVTSRVASNVELVFNKQQGTGEAWIILSQVSMTPIYDAPSWGFLQIPLSIFASVNSTLLAGGGILIGIAALFSLLSYVKARNLRKKMEFVETYLDALVSSRRKEA